MDRLNLGGSNLAFPIIELVSVEHAIDLTLANVPVMNDEEIARDESFGRYLSAPVVSILRHPRFDNSQVDGYALSTPEVGQVEFEIQETIFAGGSGNSLKNGFAAQIFTGAKVPVGTYSVVMQENVFVAGNRLKLATIVHEGGFVRKAGEDFESGCDLAEAGGQVTDRLIGLFACGEVNSVKVKKLPKVAIIITGDEVSSEPTELMDSFGIPDSIGPMLRACFRSFGIHPEIRYAVDNLELIRSEIEKAGQFDILILTGGASVGKKDFARKALADQGFQELFWKIKMRPGMPTSVHRHPLGALGFSLPGNPVSAYVSFRLLVIPAVIKSQRPGYRFTDFDDTWQERYLARDVHKVKGFAQFMRITELTGSALEPLDHQTSHLIKGLADSDGIIWLPEDVETLKKGSKVQYLKHL